MPLFSSGMIIGVLHVGTLVPRQFTDDDIGLLQSAAEQVALAIQSRLAAMERAIAAVLQRSLLPGLPMVPGLEAAARYVATQSGGVCGDWYDLFTVPSGGLSIAIGDVVGRGLGVADVMGRVDRQMQHFEPETIATVLLAMFEPSFDRLHLSSADHPPPVLALPDQPAVLVEMPSDPQKQANLPLTIDLRRSPTLPGAASARFSSALSSPLLSARAGGLLLLPPHPASLQRRPPADERQRSRHESLTGDRASKPLL